MHIHKIWQLANDQATYGEEMTTEFSTFNCWRRAFSSSKIRCRSSSETFIVGVLLEMVLMAAANPTGLKKKSTCSIDTFLSWKNREIIMFLRKTFGCRNEGIEFGQRWMLNPRGFSDPYVCEWSLLHTLQTNCVTTEKKQQSKGDNS